MKISKTCFLDEINLVLPQPLFQGHWAAGQGTEPSADTSDTGHNTRLDWGPHLCTTLHSLVSHEPPLSTEGSLPFLGFGLWRLPSTGIWRRQASPNSDHLLSWHRCSPHLLSASGLTFPYKEHSATGGDLCCLLWTTNSKNLKEHRHKADRLRDSHGEPSQAWISAHKTSLLTPSEALPSPLVCF